MEQAVHSFSVDYEIDVLNNLWRLFSKSFKKMNLENMIPLLDVSFTNQTNDSESYYNSVGIAILIAERSSFGKRILAVDNQPTWIILEQDNLVSIVENIHKSTKSMQNTSFNLDGAMDLIVFSINQTNMNDLFIKKMSLVVLTNSVEKDMVSKIARHFSFVQTPLISDLDIKKRIAVTPLLPPEANLMRCCPHIVIWNLSKNGNVEVPCGVYDTNITLLSGFSNCLYSYLSSIAYFKNNRSINDMTALQFIYHILENPRYNVLSEYLYRILH